MYQDVVIVASYQRRIQESFLYMAEGIWLKIQPLVDSMDTARAIVLKVANTALSS
jgi:hypothetical protein